MTAFAAATAINSPITGVGSTARYTAAFTTAATTSTMGSIQRASLTKAGYS